VVKVGAKVRDPVPDIGHGDVRNVLAVVNKAIK